MDEIKNDMPNTEPHAEIAKKHWYERVFPKWHENDHVCPTCNQTTSKIRGITAQNVKSLFSFRNNITEWTITLLLVFILLLAWLYTVETGECRSWLNNITENPYKTCEILINNANNKTFDILMNESINNLNTINSLKTIPINGT